MWKDDDGFLSIELHLTKLSFLKRLQYAFWYLLGGQSKFGAFEETLLDTKAQSALSAFLKQQEQPIKGELDV
jgi:hypothetical protein